MKICNLSFVLFFSFFILFNCSSNDDSDRSLAEIELDIDGAHFELNSIGTALSNGGRFLAIDGVNDSGDQIVIRLGSFYDDDADLLAETTYNVEGESTVFYGVNLVNNPQTTEIFAITESSGGVISITNIDMNNNKVSGTFSGTAIDGLGSTFVITNGSFNNLTFTFHQ